MQNKAKFFHSMGGLPLLTLAVSLLGLPLSIGALAQSAEVSQSASATSAGVVIPQQVRYAGALSNRAGETVDAVFKIYATAEGGEPLWTETQHVSVGADGSYSVLLGSVSQSGLPQAVFAAGQARWVGVSVDRGEELARSPLASVAYAMKAGDAESVGGVAAANLVTKDELAKLSQTVTTAAQVPAQGVQQAVSPTGSGTADYVALWTAAGNLGDSNIFQASSGFLGIGTTTPGGPFEVATGAVGGANATLMLEQTSAASGNYYADLGLYNSHGLIGNLSALGAGYPAGNIYGANDVVFLGGQQNATTNVLLLTNTGGALKFGTGGYAKTDERLRIGATGGVSIGNSYVATDPGAGNLIVSGNVGVGTTAPAAVLEVNGTAKFDGIITFASGQTFPVTGTGGGTITGITTSSPLTGSGTSGMVALALNTSALETTLNGVYAQLGAGDAFTGAATFSNGITSTATGPKSVAVIGDGNSGAMGVEGTSDTAIGVQGISASGIGTYGYSLSGNSGYFTGRTEAMATVVIDQTANYTMDNDNPTALSAVASGTSSLGVYASGTEFGVFGTVPAMSTGGFAVDGQATDAYAGYFANNGTDYPAVYAVNNAAGTASASPMVFEAAAAGIDAFGVYSDVTGNGATGVEGLSEGTLEAGSGLSAVGVRGAATGVDGDGLVGDATNSGGYGLYAYSGGGSDGTTRYSSAAVYAVASSGYGVEGFSVGPSATFTKYLHDGITGGVWGDTSASGSTLVAGGIVGTADENAAGFFVNNASGIATIYAHNDSTGGPNGLFKVFEASTPVGTCGIGDGDLSCTGQVKMLNTTGGGARTVETYATQSPENWIEDYGTGSMEHGVGVVQIDAGFAETVTGDASYHVFLTPRGDSKGLYVTNATAGSFEVRESSGGVSSISFDYKIVGKRRGYEAQRLVDVTDVLKAAQAETKRRLPGVENTSTPKAVVGPAMAERDGNVARVRAGVTGIATPESANSAIAKHGGAVVGPPAPSVPKKRGSVAKPVVKADAKTEVEK